jgi:hypothetical protein
MEEQLQKKIPPLLGKMIGEEIAEKWIFSKVVIAQM